MFAAAAALAGCGGGSGSSQIPAGVSNSAQQNAPGTAGAVLSGTSWQLQAGGGQDAGALQALAMLPSAIIIDVGDSVTWAVAGEAHTITFNCCAGDPTLPQGGSTFNGSNFVSSGVLVPGQHYTLTFTKAGTYKYACVLHPPEMTGTIIVQPRGTAYPGSQGFYTGLGTSALKVFLSAADIAVRSDVLFGVGGTMVAAGISPFGPSAPPSQSTVLRFLSGDRVNATSVTIRVGTTLTWKNLSSNEPHTVTFPVAGQPLPPLPGDPFTPPIGGSTYDGSHVTNSGVMNPGQSYSLTFTKAGTFGYECLFHDAFGMLGTVIVK
ncbi:MAG: plastocyanin/azurin family copper-binding protein [Candidatus Baltobacteraceae bacterium]